MTSIPIKKINNEQRRLEDLHDAVRRVHEATICGIIYCRWETQFGTVLCSKYWPYYND